MKDKRPEWRTAKHAESWRVSLAAPCRAIRDRDVDALDTADVLAVLRPLWTRVPETASRLRGRIESVLDYAAAHGWRSGENPARWRGHLANILPRRAAGARSHHAALDYREAPSFFVKLRTNPSPSAAAFALLLLTGCRVGEILGARWSEIDLLGEIWSIPAERTKAGRAHRIPLSTTALAILRGRAIAGREQAEKSHDKATLKSDFVFPGKSKGSMSNVGLRALCPSGVTIHGFQSTFRDWSGEETSFPRELAEAPLGHAIGNRVEQAYRRGDALEKRRGLMEAWAGFLDGNSGAHLE